MTEENINTEFTAMISKVVAPIISKELKEYRKDIESKLNT